MIVVVDEELARHLSVALDDYVQYLAAQRRRNGLAPPPRSLYRLSAALHDAQYDAAARKRAQWRAASRRYRARKRAERQSLVA